MPVRLGNPSDQTEEARIEIVPLIDIMFFLLASFMLVSLSMVHLRSVKIDLPTATTAVADPSKAPVGISVDRTGTLFFDDTPAAPNELAARLAGLVEQNPDLRVFISGDREARHGDIVQALDIVRGAGVQKVAFEIGDASTSATD
jgi:biopolymer transport protein ExbD